MQRRTPGSAALRTPGSNGLSGTNALCALSVLAKGPMWMFMTWQAHRRLGGMTALTEKARTTQSLTRLNAKITKNNAKNNARITLNNAKVCESRGNLELANMLYLRQLYLEIGPGPGFF
jgi:hypothetical protein